MKNYSVRYFAEEQEGPVLLFITGKEEEEDPERLYGMIREGYKKPFIFAVVCADDWDSMLSPWPDRTSFQNRPFGGEGPDFLKEIADEVIPGLDREFPLHGGIYIGGYSLAGLFSVWALYESAAFQGAVSGSGSLWYPGFTDYCKAHDFAHKVMIYLSLGKSESRTKHPLMRTAAAKAEELTQHFQNQDKVSQVKFEWNEGNHFADSAERMAKGFLWMLRQAGKHKKEPVSGINGSIN